MGMPAKMLFRKEVLDFAVAMEVTLKLNDHKGGWKNDTLEQLLYKLECEVLELRNAIEEGNSNDIICECVDVANFAMMISDMVVD